MASDSLLAPGMYRCYYCQFESTENAFKYFNNKKVDQPRHQCLNCHKLFIMGSHGRPQGKTYAKKRNEDPPELKNLSRQCRYCGVADKARFKYYNNHSRLQPRFKCLNCGNQFQMRLMGTGDEMRLVHTSSNERHATGRCKRPKENEASTNASNFSEEQIYQPSDGSFMSMLFDPSMPLEPSARLHPETCAQEDVQYASFQETDLTDENESPNAIDPISQCDANVENAELLPELSAEEAELLGLFDFESLANENGGAPNADLIICTSSASDGLPLNLSGAENAEFLAFLEAGFLTEEKEAPWNVDSFSSTANADANDGLPPWSDDSDADLINFENDMKTSEFDGVGMFSEKKTSMDSDCSSNLEVAPSGTSMVETLAPTEADSWSNNTIEDSSSANYLEAALACCKDMDMARSMPVAPEQFNESFSSNGWQEEEDDMEMAPWL